jgi:hypothetical protein
LETQAGLRLVDAALVTTVRARLHRDVARIQDREQMAVQMTVRQDRQVSLLSVGLLPGLGVLTFI